MLSNHLFLRKVFLCFFVVSLTVDVGYGTIPIASAEETKQVLYPERGYWRIIDKTGKFVSERRFERTPDIQAKDMLGAEYSPSNHYESDIHYYSFDYQGNRIRALASGPTTPCWEDGTCSEGLTSFKEDGLFGYLDDSGKKVIPAKFCSAGFFTQGYAFASLADGPCVLDTTGKIVWSVKETPPKLNDLKMGVVKVGERYFALQYFEHIKSPRFLGWFENDELYQYVHRNENFGYVSHGTSLSRKAGVALRKDGSYREADPEEVVTGYSEGLGAVKRDGRWRYVDPSGATKIMLPEKTSSARAFSEGLAVIGIDCSPELSTGVLPSYHGLGAASSSPGPFLYGVIDKSGAFVIPPKYPLTGTGFSSGLLRVGKGDQNEPQWGFINKADKLVIPYEFAGAEDFHNGIAAVFINEPALAKRKLDELITANYLDVCKKLIASATQPFYSVANLRLSVTPGTPLTLRLEKWAGPSKMREDLLTALADVDLPALPAVLVDQPNLEFSASRQNGVVVSGSAADPFNDIKARVSEDQKQTQNISLDLLSTTQLENKWQSAAAWYEWPDFLETLATTLSARYEKEHQTQKLQALNDSIKELSSGARVGKTWRQFVSQALYDANKLYLAGNVREAGGKYRKAAEFFNASRMLAPDTEWPPLKAIALYNYACFLASQKQFKESNLIFEKILVDVPGYDPGYGAGGLQDHADTYLELIRQAQPQQYVRYRALAKAALGSSHNTGFIDKQGNVFVAPDFKSAKEFKGQLAAVETVRGWGFIDKSGTWKIPPSFKTADNFGASLAPVSGKKRLFPFEEPTNERSPIKYINSAGKIAIDEAFEAASPFVDGLATVQNIGEKGSHYIDNTGKKLTNSDIQFGPVYGVFLKHVPIRMVGELQDSCFVRVNRSGPDKDGLYKFEPDDLNPFAVTNAQDELLFGYRDAQDKVVIEPKYIRALPFTEGLAAVQLASGKYGFIDKSGVIKIPAQYSSAQFFEHGLVWVSKDTKWFLIDKDGALKSDLYDRIQELNGLPGVLAYKADRQFFFSDGVFALDVTGYSTVRPFHEGLAAVEKDYKWGFIDTQGKLVIPMKYGQVGDFSEGVASAYFR